MTSEFQLDTLHHAYKEWAGDPFSISTFRRDNAKDEGFNSLDVLSYRSANSDPVNPSNDFTFVATAGLSLHQLQGPYGRIELAWKLTGRCSWEEIQALSEAIATIAVLPFYGSAILSPGSIIHNISVPIFDRMSSLLITNWGVFTPEYLPEIQPPIQLLSLKALFESEAYTVEAIGDQEACRRFVSEGVNWDDPKRACATLRENPATEPTQ